MGRVDDARLARAAGGGGAGAGALALGGDLRPGGGGGDGGGSAGGGSSVGALPELLGEEGLAAPGDAGALAAAIERLRGDPRRG